MKSKFTLLILLVAIFASCKKTTNVDVKLSTSGKLSYRLTDDAGKGLPNVKVSLFDRQDNNSNTNILLDTRLTDPNGVADFGDLNPNNYLLVADSPKVNNIAYFIQEYVQVITGGVKQREVKVTDHSGTFNVVVKSYTNPNQLLKNIGVLMIPSDKFNYSLSTAANLKVADFSGLTNADGFLTFKVPSNKRYTVFFYNSVTNAAFNYSNDILVQKGTTYSYTTGVYLQ